MQFGNNVALQVNGKTSITGNYRKTGKHLFHPKHINCINKYTYCLNNKLKYHELPYTDSNWTGFCKLMQIF